jgi:hypothetical protein
MSTLKTAYCVALTTTILLTPLASTASAILTSAPLRPLLSVVGTQRSPVCKTCAVAVHPLEPGSYWAMWLAALGVVGARAPAKSVGQAPRKSARHLRLYRHEAKQHGNVEQRGL